MTDILVLAFAIPAFAGLAVSVYYSLRRLGIEEKRSEIFREQRDNLQAYYDQRLSIEKAKLEVEKAKLEVRRNGQ